MSDPTNRMNQLLPDRQEARIRELEAAIRWIAEMPDAGIDISCDNFYVIRAKAIALMTPSETPAEPVKWIPCWCPYCGEPHSPAVRETKDG